MKTCSRCEKDKSATTEYFPPDKNKKSGLASWCRICVKEYHADLYKNNPSRKKALLERNKRAEENIKTNIMAYLKSNPCVRCGESNPIVLDFDHLGNKKFNIAAAIVKVYSWKRISKEISKCQVLCSNCHRIKTAEQFNTWKFKFAQVAELV